MGWNNKEIFFFFFLSAGGKLVGGKLNETV